MVVYDVPVAAGVVCGVTEASRTDLTKRVDEWMVRAVVTLSSSKFCFPNKTV